MSEPVLLLAGAAEATAAAADPRTGRADCPASCSQRSVLEAFLSATAQGRPTGVIAATWSAETQRRASRAVQAALRAGRLQPADIVTFSSGSTATPRGVVRDLSSWQASAPGLTALIALTDDDVVGIPGSLSSSLYLYGAWHAADRGCRVLLADEWHQAADEITVVHAVPGLLAKLVAEPDRWRRLRAVVVAGDRVSPAVRATVRRVGWDLLEYYGSVETSFVLAGRDPTLTAFPGVQVQVRDGVLWSRSPYGCRGYLDPALGGPLRRDGDWRSVGDRAVPVDGGWRVTGRPDAITTGGHTVLAADVETAVAAIPGVTAVVVVGVADSRLGAVVTAVVAGPVDTAMLRDAVRALPAPSRPRRWVRVAALPTTTSGKPDRAAAARLATGRLP